MSLVIHKFAIKTLVVCETNIYKILRENAVNRAYSTLLNTDLTMNRKF